MSRYQIFDRSRLVLAPLSTRRHDLDRSVVRALEPVGKVRSDLEKVAQALAAAKDRGATRMLMMGAHVIRSGVQMFIIDLMRRGLVSGLAFNGACVIHDFEFALADATTESVARYIRDGSFGMWNETGIINEVVADAATLGLGFGEAMGRYLCDRRLPGRDISLLAAAYEMEIPVTVHVGIGQDIIHQHPNCDGAALGQASYTDFLIYTEQLRKLSGGVVMNFGSAVMAPEIYLKALSMVRNLARQKDEKIRNFTTLVCDLHPLPTNYGQEAEKNDPFYYFRPWKTMLVRTTAEGGQSVYVCGRHEHTVPELWTAAAGLQDKSQEA